MRDRLFTERARGQFRGQLPQALLHRVRVAVLVGLGFVTVASGAVAGGSSPIRQRLDALERSQETIISHYEVGLAGIGILLGVVAILFPIVTYFTAILPTRREVEKVANLENRLDAKFSEFLESAEATRFNRLIEKATGTDSDARREAAGRLTLEDSTWLTEQHIALLRTAIDDEKDVGVRSQLVHAALSKPTRHGDRIVSDIMRAKFVGLEGRALSYIARDPRPELVALLDEKLAKAEKRFETAFQLIGGAAVNREAMILLLQRPVWRTALPRHERARLLPQLNTWMLAGYLTKDDLRASAWGDMLDPFVIFWRVEKNQMVSSDSPDRASMAQVFEDGVEKRSVFPRDGEFRELVEQAKAAGPTADPE
jgi:hypothetical protein